MAKDPLAEAGFYFDELNKLRVLEPDVSQKTSELKEECKEFVDSKHRIFYHPPHPPSSVINRSQCVVFFFFLTEIGQFQKVVGGLIELVDELAKEAETEKMKVSLKSYDLISQSSETLRCV